MRVAALLLVALFAIAACATVAPEQPAQAEVEVELALVPVSVLRRAAAQRAEIGRLREEIRRLRSCSGCT